MRSFLMVAGGIAVSFLAAGLLTAAEPTANAGKDVESLLRKLSNAYVTKDMDTIRQLTSGDKVSVLSGGHRRFGLPESLNDLNITDYRIENLQVAMPTNDMTVFTYQAAVKGTRDGKPLPPKIMASSVWSKQNGKWLEVLYQETPVDNR